MTNHSTDVDVADVSFTYPAGCGDVLHNVSYTAQSGEVVLLCGASGSGKSSALRLVNGLIPHFHEGVRTGSVTVAGHEIAATELHDVGRFTATVFQNPRTQFFTTEVDTEMAFANQNYRLDPDIIIERTAAALQQVGIEDLSCRKLKGLSGGQLQKVACAQALAQQTSVILFDEPTSNLDPATIDDIARIVSELKAQGKTVLIAEHRVYFLKGLADRVLVLEDGRIVEEMTGDEFFALTDDKRRDMGLRTLCRPHLTAKEDTRSTGPHATSDDEGAGITVDRLTVTFGKHRVLDLAGVAFPRGLVTGLIGPNGAGKTTLVRTICGLNKPDKGSVICLDGKELRPGAVGHAFLVMQDVHRQLFAESVAAEAGEKYLQALGLEALAERHPMSLSGGQKQRLVIATALERGSPVVIFDEPTSGVDYRHLTAISAELKELAAQGKVVIVISHDIEFLNHCADRFVAIGPSEAGGSSSVIDASAVPGFTAMNE